MAALLASVCVEVIASLAITAIDLGGNICLRPSKDVSFNAEDAAEAWLVVVCIGLVLADVWLLTVPASVVDPLGAAVDPLAAPAASGTLGSVAAAFVPLGAVVDPLAAPATSGTLGVAAASDPLPATVLWAHATADPLPGAVLWAHAAALPGALNGDLNDAIDADAVVVFPGALEGPARIHRRRHVDLDLLDSELDLRGDGDVDLDRELLRALDLLLEGVGELNRECLLALDLLLEGIGELHRDRLRDGELNWEHLRALDLLLEGIGELHRDRLHDGELDSFEPTTSGGLNLLIVHLPVEDDNSDGEHNISDDDEEEDQPLEDDNSVNEFCVFGNEFTMNNTQTLHLKDVIYFYPNAPIKQYVYCLTCSSLNKMGNMQEEACPVRAQPITNGGRSDRRASSFKIIMPPNYEEFVSTEKDSSRKEKRLGEDKIDRENMDNNNNEQIPENDDYIPVDEEDENILVDDDDDDYIPADEDDDYIPDDSDGDYIPADDDDDYIPHDSDDDDDDEKKKITVRGSGYTGDESFDRYCIFGNEVEMNFHQMMQLRSYVEDLPSKPMKEYLDELPRPAVKRYVCRLTKSLVNPDDGEMEFSQGYTKAYLIKFLMTQNAMKRGIPVRSEVIGVVVNSTKSSLDKYCRMSLDVSGMAKITLGWPKVVKAFSLKEGGICMFTFEDERGLLPVKSRDQFGTWLRLTVMKLETLE
ncbi:hypothetical protein ACQ4PT_053349 [Festuca glaucescens]